MAELTVPADGTTQYFHASWRGAVTTGNTTGLIEITRQAPISLALSPGSGVTAAYWEFTITPRDVIAGDAANAIWHKWPLGDIAAADGAKVDAILGPITAVRGTSNGGTATFEVLADDV
jgi:hypothetical protein